MAGVELFKHNEIGYQKLTEALEEHDSATINHATGTGKSFIAIKYMYENRDKKILYLAPTYFILRQLERDCKKLGISINDLPVDRMIYRTLLDKEMEDVYKKYDVIICDEFHRLGAKGIYIKLKQLKYLQKQSDEKKKFIGLSATPIRYLDNERNMTEELFDGVEASRLSLAEAMVEGILPIPMYINSKLSCAYEAIRVARRIAQMAPSKEKEKLQNKLEKVKKQVSGTTINYKEMIEKYVKEKDGKFIIFCPTIAHAKKCYDTVDKWFEHFGKIKKYLVHSAQQYSPKERERQIAKGSTGDLNQDNLNNFNDDKNGISVMICIDVLNEGVHVDNVDNIIFFRRTMSPRIYFQQIGRLLSFSGRRQNVRVFDLVDNIANHKAIYDVYDEFLEEIEKRIAANPEKREEYEEIISRFKISNETITLIKELQEISKEVTPEKIIESKITYAIKIINDFIKNNNIKGTLVPFVVEDKQLKKAYVAICKYYKYVTNEQFERLLETEVVLPQNLMMTLEERKELLQGYNSIYEKEMFSENESISEICDFISQKGELPKLNSEDTYEKALAYRYLNLLFRLSQENKEKLHVALLKEDVSLRPWEKVVLDEELEQEDIDTIIAISTEVVNANKSLPDYIYRTIDEIVIKYTLKETQTLIELMEKSDKIDYEKRKAFEEERQKQLAEIEEEIKTIVGSENEREQLQEIFIKVSNFNVNDRNYIMKKFRKIKKDYYEESINSEEASEMVMFCRQLKTMSIEEIETNSKKIQNDKHTYLILLRFVNFLDENEGEPPREDSKNEAEACLAKEYEEALKSGKIDSNFNQVIYDFSNGIVDIRKTLVEMLNEQMEECLAKEIILKYAEFILRRGRKALENSSNEEEQMLALNFKNVSENYLTIEPNEALMRIFNTRKILEKTTKQFVRNTLLKSQETHEEV